MIIGLDTYGQPFDTVLGQSKIYNMTIRNAKFDEIKIDEAINTYSNTKEQWDYDTVFLSPFQGNLKGGNVDFIGMSVSKLRIKRRKSEEFDWQIINDWDFDIKKQDYEFYDKFVEAYQPYEYSILPVMDSGTEGEMINIQEITPVYNSSFILDKNNNIPLIYDVEYSNVTRNQKSEKIEPFNSKYPIVIENGSLDYIEGNTKVTVIASDLNNGAFDIRQERLHRKKILDFLCNKKPKMLKGCNGEIWIIKIIGNPTIDYRNNVGQVIADIQFNWVEIADAQNIEDIKMCGLL